MVWPGHVRVSCVRVCLRRCVVCVCVCVGALRVCVCVCAWVLCVCFCEPGFISYLMLKTDAWSPLLN